MARVVPVLVLAAAAALFLSLFAIPFLPDPPPRYGSLAAALCVDTTSDQAAYLSGAESVTTFAPSRLAGLDSFDEIEVRDHPDAEVDYSGLFAVSVSTSTASVIVSDVGATVMDVDRPYTVRLDVSGTSGRQSESGALDMVVWLMPSTSTDSQGTCP